MRPQLKRDPLGASLPDLVVPQPEALTVYLDDLTDYDGYTGTERRFCGLPLLNVGWMEPPHPMPTGTVPIGFPERLFAFCAWDKLVNFLGGHQDCGYCQATYYDHQRQLHTPLGNGELRVLGDGVAFAAPSLIYHYVAAHAYLTPVAFVVAVMNGAPPDGPAHLKYRFHWWEATIADAIRHKPRTPMAGHRTSAQDRPGAILGPLVWRCRALAVLSILAGIACVTQGPLWVSVLALLALASLGWFIWKGLNCPTCERHMSLPFREPTGWSLTPESPWSTLYCHNCGVGLRPTTALWGDPVAEVTTWWC